MLTASIASVLGSSDVLGSDAEFAGRRSGAPDFEPVRNRILQTIAAGGATGVAVAVAHGGRIVFEEGFGWANREAGVKATPHTPFSMASITKPFTCTTLMTLVAEGKLSLDAPANTYLAKSRITGPNGHADKATVRLLGAHVSGLPGMFESYDRSESKLALSPGELLREYGKLAYPPGACYEYSNIGFAALDAIASNLTGADFGTLMQQRLLSPLGLHDSFFDTAVERLAGAAIRYDSHGRPIPYYTTSSPASGELYASAHDLARFAMFTMKNRLTDQKRILEDRWIDDLQKEVFTGPSGIATTFGWFTGRLKSGVPFIFKSGGQAGVATILYMVPSENLACLVLTNQSNARELAYSVCDQLAAMYLPLWLQPQEYSGYTPSPFVVTPSFRGRWEGMLQNGRANMRVRLNIKSSDKATFALGMDSATDIGAMRSEGDAFTGTTTGTIDAPDALRTGAKALDIKLLPHQGKLVGRVFASAGDPNIKNIRLPYVLTMDRVPG